MQHCRTAAKNLARDLNLKEGLISSQQPARTRAEHTWHNSFVLSPKAELVFNRNLPAEKCAASIRGYKRKSPNRKHNSPKKIGLESSNCHPAAVSLSSVLILKAGCCTRALVSEPCVKFPTNTHCICTFRAARFKKIIIQVNNMQK